MSWLLYFEVALVGIITAAFIYVYRKITYWDRMGVPNTGFFAQIFAYRNRQAGDLEIEWYKKYGPIYGTYLFFSPVLILGEENHVRDICIKDFSKFRNHTKFPSLDPRLDLNVFILRDEYWKKMRQVLAPAFSSTKLKAMSECIVPCIDTFLTNLTKLKGSPISTKKYFDCLIMDVILSVAYGTKIDCLNDPDNELVRQAKRIFKSIQEAFEFSSLIKGVDTSCLDYISKLNLELVEQRRKENEADPSGTKRGDFLQVLVDAKYHPDGPTLTDDEICSFGLTFFSDGFETTSTTLTGLAYYLAKDEKAQKKLYEEVSKLSEINSDTVGDLKYLEAAVKETLRLWPAILRNDRLAEEDYKLAGTKFTIPAGMSINFPLYAMQRDPKNFEDPDEFKPERWLAGGANENSGPLAIQTFGIGPRVCVGQRLAILNTKLTIARILQKMRIEATPDSKLENEEGMNLIVVPKDCFLKFLPR